MEIKSFFDERTFTLTYIVWDNKTLDGILIDSVLDYDPVGSKIWTESLKLHVDFIKANKINIHYIMETHAHADHLSASPYLKKVFPKAKIVIGEHITEVQKVFKEYFQLEELVPDGSQFDMLLKDGEELIAGSIKIKVIHTPGHTPACASYLIDDALFVGDALFMPDYGTGRCDFPKGDAHALYNSITEKIYKLNDSTRIFVGHDYMPGGRDLKFETTVGESKKKNIQLPISRSEEEFVTFRKDRDSGLSAPKLLYQSVMVNICGGGIPKSNENKKAYFKLPVNVKDTNGFILD
jgi:glyoxylase-like metal-dependent hydrolase (beta-lactamase superfamily II)